jgi:hypothetical protein
MITIVGVSQAEAAEFILLGNGLTVVTAMPGGLICALVSAYCQLT